jgi:Ser/Thr protein kinase RdoA (MazF antagonist)
MFDIENAFMVNQVLLAFGINPAEYQAQAFGSGLINYTWKISGTVESYILQRINKSIFKSPQAIADNLLLLDKHFKVNAPGYLFVAPLPAQNGAYLVEFENEHYRLAPFVKNSHTVNGVSNSGQAYEAALQFGKFANLLADFDTQKLQYTLPNFHNLSLRYQQFQIAIADASTERLTRARAELERIIQQAHLVDTYQTLMDSGQLPIRPMHHDTKINNVLFDDNDAGLCVIDLDTVMPGYFISDVGDMMRTYLCPANEEERDLSQIKINTEYFEAIYKGYMQHMGKVLTLLEKDLFIYAGQVMIYMQAIRFLTDFLNGDVYYNTQYPGQNLARAQNQLTLLARYSACEEQFKAIIGQINKPSLHAL